MSSDKKYLLALFAVMIIPAVSGCDQPAEKSLDPVRLARAYTDLVFEPFDSTLADSAAQVRAVLERHEMTPEEFQYSLEFYRQNPEKWLEVFTEVQKEMEKRKAGGRSQSGKPPLPQKK